MLFQAEALTKRYPGVLANDGVSFAVRRGEIHALLGENGAGKSTLMKIVYGLVQPDAGSMSMHGRPYRPSSPAAARASGVGMVFQHFSLFEALTVAENIAMALPERRARHNLSARIRALSEEYGLPIQPERVVGDLSVGERQRVEIVRCLLQGPGLLILDEPTSVLTPKESEVLFATLRRLAAEGIGVVFISHKLQEIRQLCHAATVLRGGRVVATCDPREESPGSLATMMIGPLDTAVRAADTAAMGPTRLEVTGLSLPATTAFGTPLQDIRFSVRAGEVLGIGGVAGNGQSELMQALTGERLCAADAIRFDGQPMGQRTPEARRQAGMAFAPEQRLGHSLAPDLPLVDNTYITARSRIGLVRRGVLQPRAAQAYAQRVVDALDVRTTGTQRSARSLSGGNQQKFVIGRELLQRPEVFVAEQPTWGVDAGAAAAIRQQLLDLAARGAAIVLISQDLDELLSMCSRFAVLSAGRLSEARRCGDMSAAEIGLLMSGARPGTPGGSSEHALA
jgi:simple sugar transport system ATP-binding protein